VGHVGSIEQIQALPFCSFHPNTIRRKFLRSDLLMVSFAVEADVLGKRIYTEAEWV